jgi:hypothetical protein
MEYTNSTGIIPHQIFIKGKKYSHGDGDLIVLCTKTTCNYSSKTFQGTVLSSKEYPIGSYSKGWLTSTFKEYKNEQTR